MFGTYWYATPFFPHFPNNSKDFFYITTFLWRSFAIVHFVCPSVSPKQDFLSFFFRGLKLSVKSSYSNEHQFYNSLDASVWQSCYKRHKYLFFIIRDFSNFILFFVSTELNLFSYLYLCVQIIKVFDGFVCVCECVFVCVFSCK